MFRKEHDMLGTRDVPAEALYGIHALRAAENFPLSGRPLHPELITSLALVKQACARVNAALGWLEPRIAAAIEAACEEVVLGEHADAFLTDALQGGAGTSANMNMNEVLANLAIRHLGGRCGEYSLVHPLAHVNLHQSTNDVFPTAVRVAAIRLGRTLEANIAALQQALQDLEPRFGHIVRLGRTELNDAVPLAWSSTLAAWAEAMARDRWRVFKCEERLRVVNLGGGAIGTGLGAPRRFIFGVVEALRDLTGLGLARAEHLVDATQNLDALVEAGGILKAHAVNLLKISNDLRLLASGPCGGLGEIHLPERQAGSSAMPGKVNPVICEAVAQAAMAAMGQEAVLAQAAGAGQLELNAFTPLAADALLTMYTLLAKADAIFTAHCVAGLTVDETACQTHVDRAWSVLAAFVPLLGYDRCVEAAGIMRRSGRGLREVLVDGGFADAATVARVLSPAALTALGVPEYTGGIHGS
ncbi:MAG: aspartate ammonia-lyase [Desulfovibrio sp.]|nr:aspartate ammonia-lyase [Desulfovibrio sp.]